MQVEIRQLRALEALEGPKLTFKAANLNAEQREMRPSLVVVQKQNWQKDNESANKSHCTAVRLVGVSRVPLGGSSVSPSICMLITLTHGRRGDSAAQLTSFPGGSKKALELDSKQNGIFRCFSSSSRE